MGREVNTSDFLDCCFGSALTRGDGGLNPVCAIRHRWDPKSQKSETDQVIPIIVGRADKPFAWDLAKLGAENPEEKKDAKREGLRVTFLGGSYQQRAQRTVVDFRCNPALVGTEGEWESMDEYEKGDGKKERGMMMSRRDDEGDGDASTPETQLRKDGAALIWDGYRRDKDDDGKDMDSLYLTWYTKYVCDAAVEHPAESKHWGFFTWLVIL